MTLPPVLYRWMDEKQAKEVLFGDAIAATWKHLLPGTKRLTKGVSFGDNPVRWKEEHEYVVCMAFATENWPDHLTVSAINGEAIFKATNNWEYLRTRLRLCQDPEATQQYKEDARRLLASLTEATANPDEWFVHGDFKGLRDRLVGMVVLSSADIKFRWLIQDMERDGSLSAPVEHVSHHVDYDHDLLVSEMDRAFAHLADNGSSFRR
jgi:hypothetical protein